MPKINDVYGSPAEMVLGTRVNARISESDQRRQRAEVDEILRRLHSQPGVILADEVGMGKTFVALAIAYAVAIRSPRGPVIVMVPANLVDKWTQDLMTFCELYLEKRHAVQWDGATRGALLDSEAVRYGVARHSVELMKFLDDPPRIRCHLIFLAQGAMGRRQTDKWIRLALIAEALRRHGRRNAKKLVQIKSQIHRFLAQLLWTIGEERAHYIGERLWKDLLEASPEAWKDLYNKSLRDDRRRLLDDPVPKSVQRALQLVDLALLAAALEQMPLRARGGDDRVKERIDHVRTALRQIEQNLWKQLLSQTRWRSPLLVMDEAHHLKNPGTLLARQLQSLDSERDLRTGDSAMANAFDRMLFLTATPFQLGHNELVSVLDRFGDVRWDETGLGPAESFRRQLTDLNKHLSESQRTAIALQRSWSHLQTDDCNENVDIWWDWLLRSSRESLTNHQRSVVDAFEAAKLSRDAAEKALHPWIVRQNKGIFWIGTHIKRRQRVEGTAVAGKSALGGLLIPPQELLPFFLAARSAANAGQDLLGEALCSSYEAFRFTRRSHDAAKDEEEDSAVAHSDFSQSRWYLGEFDRALARSSGLSHPKMDVTVRKAVDLWQSGEKVLVFAFYRHTCRALRIHISQEIERRIMTAGQDLLREAGRGNGVNALEQLLGNIQKRYFDVIKSPGRRAVDTALSMILERHSKVLKDARMTDEQKDLLLDVMRRFLRATSTIVRCFPLAELDSIGPAEVVARTLNRADSSGDSWGNKFERFIDFLTERCSAEERKLYLEAARGTQTGGIRVEDSEREDSDADAGLVTLANVQVATGTTHRDARARLMRSFNTPFFPDVLVCSQVMGEGVDLQHFCRHVIHHDLAWNPSTIEQRTGRIDRIGCKAEGRQPIVVYLPYLAGTADERQYRVMSDREQWFRIVMGQEEVARLITQDSASAVPLPDAISRELSFKLNVVASPS